MLLKTLMRVSKSFFILILACYIPLQSMAWGALGHRIVGEIADSYLSPNARKEIKKILGNESLAMSSTWADFVKSDTAYNYLYDWHFINFEYEMELPEMQAFLEKDTAVDAYSKLIFISKELKRKTLSPIKKQLYLRMLVHIVGDLHQPLHASQAGNKGGNDVKVMWFRESSNLHRVWDENLVEFQQLSYTELAKAINFTTPAQVAHWQKEPISKWVYESNLISRKLNADITEPNQKLGYKYNYDYVKTMNQQLLKGGVHLAGLLNDIFSE